MMSDNTQYFATFDVDGWPTGYYPSDVWFTPPEGAVEITVAQYRLLLTGQAKYVDGKVVESPPKPLEDPQG